MRNLRVGCTLEFDVGRTAELTLQLAVARRPGVTVDDRLDARLDDRAVAVAALDTPDGGRVHLITAGPGRLRIDYEGQAAVESAPAAVTPLARMAALQPSRYCPSDRLAGFADAQFGPIDDPAVIAAFVHDRTRYVAGASTVTTDAVETLLSGAGVCRDYAHLVCALCRAVGIPARLAAVYAPGLSPMDFHAVAEVAVGGVWQVVDATRLAPRPALLRIATGPDASATAFATVQSGTADLVAMNVRAIIDGDLPIDDHTGPVTLA